MVHISGAGKLKIKGLPLLSTFVLHLNMVEDSTRPKRMQERDEKGLNSFLEQTHSPVITFISS